MFMNIQWYRMVLDIYIAKNPKQKISDVFNDMYLRHGNETFDILYKDMDGDYAITYSDSDDSMCILFYNDRIVFKRKSDNIWDWVIMEEY